MHTLSRLAGALAFPVLLAGCVGAPAVVEPAYAPAPAPVVLQQPALPAPVALAPAIPVQPAPVAPSTPVVAYGLNCFAGFYQCQLPAAGPIGGECTCPGLGGPSYGTIR